MRKIDAVSWFNGQSFGNGTRNRDDLETARSALDADATWDSWDAESRCWRHWARTGGVIVETDEIGIPLAAPAAAR